MMRSLVFVMGLVAVGCHSHEESSLIFEAPRSRYPVSLTSSLADANGIVDPKRIHPVGKLTFSTNGCVPTRSFDLSSAINQQVDGAKGNAVVRFVIDTQRDTDCIEAKVTADIVKVDP